jgi:nicotinate dehydrogenase subunit B
MPHTLLHGRVVRPVGDDTAFAGMRARGWAGPPPAGDGDAGAWAQGLARAAAGGDGAEEIVAVAVRGRFVGVVAVTAAAAARAADRLRAQWAAQTATGDTRDEARDNAGHDARDDVRDHARHDARDDAPDDGGANPFIDGGRPSAPRVLASAGDVSGTSGTGLARSYRWPTGQRTTSMSDPHDGSRPAAHAAAQLRDGQVDIWAQGMDDADAARSHAEIAVLLGVPVEAVRIHRGGELDAAHIHRRGEADAATHDSTAARDAAADAALLAHATGQAVWVTLTIADLYRPLAQDCVVGIEGELAPPDGLSACTVAASAPLAHRPAHALLLTGMAARIAPEHWAGDAACRDAADMADATAVPPYSFGNLYATRDTPARVATAPEAVLCHVFAHESYMDEVARSAGIDPVVLRLRHLQADPRGAALVLSVAERAQWWSPRVPADVRAAGNPAPPGNDGTPRTANGAPASDDKLRGRGFAYARVPQAGAAAAPGATPDAGAHAWSAWVADVEVDPANGQVAVTRLVVGQDIGALRQAPMPAAGRADIMAATQALLGERPGIDDAGARTLQTGGSAQPSARATPIVDVVPRPAALSATWQLATASPALTGTASAPALLVAGPALTLPAAAALANAIHDATGIRLREPPFSAERVHAALQERARSAMRRTRAWWLGAVAAVAATAGVVAAILPWRAPIAPVQPPDPTLYSQATLARGRLVAAAGNCVVCHTAQDGAPNAGGRAMETPFGAVYSTNITPDPRTGIGAWSYAAFERAMRQGISRDGHHLYPVFPYTSFTRLSDADMQALYAYLMAQPPVASAVPPTRLRFPYARPLMSAWNAWFLDAGSYRPDPTQSSVWNRGAYLVQGAGHCGACHTPRNAAGAEKKGAAFLSGGMVDGWEAPALNAQSKAPVPWTEEALYTYLRTGFSAAHGVAAGPMAPVVRQLALLPQEDVRAMAVYLASLNPGADAAAANRPARQAMAGTTPTATGATAATATPMATASATATATATAVTATAPAAAATTSATAMRAADDRDGRTRILTGAGAQIYQGACAACHDQGAGPQWFGVKPALPLNTSVHSASPDNLIQVILNGVPRPASPELGYMPGYKDVLGDGQVAELLHYLRAAYAPDQPAWQDVQARVARLRATPYQYTHAVQESPGRNTGASADGGH